MVPNPVLDALLPDLKDTELRVLLVLVRQTFGWNRPHRPVVLSYRALKERTGRESEAIARAIGSLRARGLIHSDPPLRATAASNGGLSGKQ